MSFFEVIGAWFAWNIGAPILFVGMFVGFLFLLSRLGDD